MSGLPWRQTCFILDLVYDYYDRADNLMREYELESGCHHTRKKSIIAMNNDK